MFHNRKKKALYEVIGKAGTKSGYGKTLEQLHPEKTGEAEPAATGVSAPRFGKVSIWAKKPRVMQFNAGRLEISMPYQLAVALLLGLILLIFVAFWLGRHAKSKQGTATFNVRQPAIGKNDSKAIDLPAAAEKPKSQETKITAGTGEGDQVIVLVEYKGKADLVPVQRHFAEYGIETEILEKGERYFLITRDRYQNTEKPDSDGYKARQKIIEVGAKYKGKAPEGYETFAPNFFKDAYGRKVGSF